MTTDRTQEEITEIRLLVSEACRVLVDASDLIWAELDTDERAMLHGYVTTHEWGVPTSPAALRTYLNLEALGMVSSSEATGGAVETTVFADALVSIRAARGSEG